MQSHVITFTQVRERETQHLQQQFTSESISNRRFVADAGLAKKGISRKGELQETSLVTLRNKRDVVVRTIGVFMRNS